MIKIQKNKIIYYKFKDIDKRDVKTFLIDSFSKELDERFILRNTDILIARLYEIKKIIKG